MKLFYKPVTTTDASNGERKFGFQLIQPGNKLLYVGPTYRLMLDRIREEFPISVEPDMPITGGLPSNLGTRKFDDTEFKPCTDEQVKRVIAALKGL